jgi:hypothetical protein
MIEISIYLKSTGQIVANQSVLSLDDIVLADTHGYIEGSYPLTHKKWNGSEVVDYTVPYVSGTNEDKVRMQRNQLLAVTDWTQLPNSPLTDAKKAEWATYRQQLRDIMDSYTDSESNTVDTVSWPTPPS